MAWVDRMRMRRLATLIRAAGWTAAGLMFGMATLAALSGEGEHVLPEWGALAAGAAVVLGIAHALAWLVDRRGERLISR